MPPVAASEPPPRRPAWVELAPGVELAPQAWTRGARRLLEPGTVDLLARLHRELEPERRALLRTRARRQADWDRGALPAAAGPEMAVAREPGWRVAPLPPDLLRRRVEITGPADDPKMVVNMLTRNGAGDRADAAMLDFEDSMCPTWSNVVRGHENVAAAAAGTLTHRRPASSERAEKLYRIDPDDMPVVMVRCRGLHLDEARLRIDGRPVAAGLFDLALTVRRTARVQLARGRTPKVYVPKVEHHLEARWWQELLSRLEAAEGHPRGTVRATFLIETLPAAMQIEEILYELRTHAAGLNVGRWDKIFSDLKVLMEHSDRVLADRATLTMDRPWMRDYATRLIGVCHQRGALAMGGMAAFTPGRTPERRAEQTEKVVADKRQEAALGHDGCWVSHPYFIGPARSAFSRDNQLDVQPPPSQEADLLPRGGGPYTLAGLRTNVRVGIAYLEGWQRGRGCVAWDDLMEDLATLEISRAQTWQWWRHGVTLEEGATVTRELIEALFGQELARILEELTVAGADAETLARFERAAQTAARVYTASPFCPFLTCSADPEPGPVESTIGAARCRPTTAGT